MASDNPRTHFSFPGCALCVSRPCRQLRFGGARVGTFLLVPRGEYTPLDCAFAARDFSQVRWVATRLPAWELSRQIRHAIERLPIGERMDYRTGGWSQRWESTPELLLLLERLWTRRQIVCVYIPANYEQNHKLRTWLEAHTARFRLEGEIIPDDPLAGPAITDEIDLEEHRHRPEVSLTNPRWKHGDASRAKQSPDAAADGDRVTLLADTTGISDGTYVTFSLFDNAQNPAQALGTVRGTVRNKVAQAQWTVPQGAGERMTVVFDAAVQGKRTVRVKVGLASPVVWGVCNTIENTPVRGRTFLIVDSQNNEVMFRGTTNAQGEIAVPFVREKGHTVAFA